MPSFPPRFPIAVLLGACVLLSAGPAIAGPPQPGDEAGAERTTAPVRYVVLEGGGPDQGPGPDVAANMRALAERFGPAAPLSGRRLAYGVQQLRILSRSPTVVRADVDQALDLAEETGVPVFLHVDSCYGWGADDETRPEDAPPVKFWDHPAMREWDRFPAGDSLPDRIPRPWLNWGPWCSPAPAVPAFGSPEFVAFATSQLDQGVLAPLADRLERWRRDGREHLFAGINVAWEAHVPDFGEPAMRRLIERSGIVRAEYPRSARGVTMDPELVGRSLGFASLHWRGWDEARLNASAAAEGVSRDERFRQLCYGVLHDYMAALAKACHDRGLEADRVYTHIVAQSTVQPAGTTRPPIWTAVNRYSTPGFTMDRRGAARYDLQELKRRIRQATGEPTVRFGVVESYFRLGDRTYVTEPAECRRELEALFDAGASVQAFYGTFPLSAGRTPEAALVALEQWLADRPAPATPH